MIKIYKNDHKACLTISQKSKKDKKIKINNDANFFFILHIKKPGLKNLLVIYIGYDKMKKTTQSGYIYMTHVHINITFNGIYIQLV